jgi:Chain length determinant protein
MVSSRFNPDNQQPTEEMTIKEIILKIQEWWAYLWKKKFIIILFGLIGAGLGIAYALTSKPKYEAQLVFVMEDNKSGSMGAYAGIASQFGLDLGGMGSSNGAFTGDNILELLKSRLLVEKTLLSGTIVRNGSPISLADDYLAFKEMKKGWQGRPELLNISYPLNADRKSFSLLQDSLLNEIQKSVVAAYLKIAKVDKKLSFISVTCTSENELFSKRFAEKLVEVATNFYIETKTKRNKVNVDRLQDQADSLEATLNRRTYRAAAVQDLNINPAKQVASVGVELALRDKMVSQTMYAEIVKNLEMSKISMVQETPIIQIVDSPILPLEKKKLSRLKALIVGGIIGGLLCVFYLLFRKALRDILNS